MVSVPQTVLPLQPSSLPIHRYSRRQAGQAAHVLADLDIDKFGIAISQTDDGTIDHIAFATPSAVYLIDACMSDARDNGGLDAWFKALLGSTTTVLAGFGMPRIALRLHHHLRYHVRGIDLSTLFTTNGTAWLPSKVVQKICFLGNTFSVDSLWHENDQKASVEKLCLRAWISAKVITSDACYTSMQTVRKVDTRHIRKDILLCLGTLLRQNDIIARANPRVTTNEYESFTLHKDGNMALHNSRFKTRVRVSNQSYVEVTSKDGTTHKGNAVKAHGRTTMVQFQKTLGDKLESVRVVGLDQPTTSEQARDAFLLRILQDQDKLLDSEFVRYIWFPNREDTALLDDRSALSLNSSLTTYVMHLNNSQRNVVAAMVSHDPIIVVHGPPGTGKTTTISSAAEIWSKVYSNPVWIIGHSNVSVKNIAEKLVKQKVDFKLIVSKDFYVEWHEHIYHEIEGRLIRTDELPQDSVGLSRVIGSSRVILSTLGLLSNPALDNNGTFKIVPFERVVVDEASQINVFEFMHIFHKFRKSLVKLCFFGDPKQLPPFGQEKAKTLQSIFEVEHLKKTSYFLNVQYRMPVPLGSFISSHIYDGRLTSDHTNKQLSCIRFVDTPRGAEEKSGFSWINEGETKTIVDLVRNYYRNASFCIITPYDAQRAAIERALKAEGLPWENVFNVDSFQGNERDYVLISVVRSAHVGFLHSRQRMNVMLTRCRQGMVIVSSKSFLEGVARDTLIGKLSAYWNRIEGCSSWVGSADIMNSRVHLPSVVGKNADPVAAAAVSYRTWESLAQYSAPQPSKRFDVSKLFKKPLQPHAHTPARTCTPDSPRPRPASILVTPPPLLNHSHFPALSDITNVVPKGSNSYDNARTNVSWATTTAIKPRKANVSTSPFLHNRFAAFRLQTAQKPKAQVSRALENVKSPVAQSVLSPSKSLPPSGDGWIKVQRRRRR